jgi:hypothetical protein
VLGFGVLLLADARRRLRGVVLAGTALFAGMAAAAVALPPVAYAGLAPSVPVVAVLALVVLAAGTAVDRRRSPATAGESVTLGLLPGAALAVPLVLLAVVAIDKPVDRYDAFANWTLKAKLLVDDRSFAAASIAPPVSRQFPIGLPALDGHFLDANGGNVRVAHLASVALLAVFALTVWGFLRPRVGALPLAAGLAFILWMPDVRDQSLTDYADVPLAWFFAAAALGIGLWLAGERVDRLVLGSLFAAAALATKRDAIAFCFVLFVLAAVAALIRRRPLLPLFLAALAVAVSTVPWRIFVAVNGLEDRDVNLSVSRAVDRADELPFVLRRFGDLFLHSSYLGVVPLAALAAVVLLASGRDRPLAVATLAIGLGLIAALAYVYLSGVAGVHYLVRTSAYRTLMTPTVLAAALLPLLLTKTLSADRPRSPRPPPS